MTTTPRVTEALADLPDTGPVNRRRRLVVAWLGSAVTLAGLLIQTIVFPGQQVTKVAVDTAILVGSGLVAVTGFRAAGRLTGAYRRAWYIISILVPFVGLGNLTGLIADFGPDTAPARSAWAPGFGDFALLMCVPVAFVAVLFIAPARDRLTRIRAFADAVLIAGAGLFVAWILGLSAIANASQGNAIDKLVRIDSPLIDLTFLALLIFIIAGSPRSVRLSFGLIAGSVLAHLVGDTSVSLAALHAQPTHGVPGDVASCSAFALVFLGCLHARKIPHSDDLNIASPLHLLVPYAAVAGALVAGVYTQIKVGHLDPLLTWDGIVIAGLILLRQVLELQENVTLTRELETSEARFRGLVQNSMDATLLLDSSGTVMFAAPSVKRIFGVMPEELIHHKLIRLIHPDDVGAVVLRIDETTMTPGTSRNLEFQIRHRDGHWIRVEAIPTNLLTVRGVEGIVLNMWDVTERRDLEDRLRQLAFHDPLTGLANRALFHDRLEHALDTRAQRDVALLYLDIDDFKLVNDTFGHAVGDELLVSVAGRITDCLRGGDTAARLGGDEFAILLEDSDQASADRIGQRLLEALRKPYDIGDHTLMSSVSIGIAVGRPGARPDSLVHQADTALYASKSSGKGKLVTFKSTIDVLNSIPTRTGARKGLSRPA